MKCFVVRSGLLAAALVALAACNSNWDKEPDPNIVPTRYKQEVIDTMTRVLIDPTNVREAYISEPAINVVKKEPRYTVCVRSNSRDYNRNYSGSKDRIATFYAGHLTQLIDATPEQCGKAAYKPFPELEKLCLSTKCE
jgi:hypothetical protein